MPVRPIPQHRSSAHQSKAIIALFLTFAAGYVDIVGFVRVARTFTAHMTGNTVHLAHRLAGADWHRADLSLAALVAFILGSIAGRCIIEAGARHGLRRIASLTLALECVLIAIATALAWSSMPDGRTITILIALGGAMGVQTATLTRVGPLTIHTTFVTGMLNKLAQLVSHALFLSYDTFIAHRPRHVERKDTVHEALYIFSVWLMYFFGGVIGAILAGGSNLRSLLLPLAILLVAIVTDQLQPLSLQEEQEELTQAA